MEQEKEAMMRVVMRKEVRIDWRKCWKKYIKPSEK